LDRLAVGQLKALELSNVCRMFVTAAIRRPEGKIGEVCWRGAAGRLEGNVQGTICGVTLPWTEYRGPSADAVQRRQSKKFTSIRSSEHDG
jgi:hypothetical protein